MAFMRYCRDNSRDKVNEIANVSALDGKVSSGILEDYMLKRMTWGPAKLKSCELCVLHKALGSPTTGKIRLDGPKNILVVLTSNRTPTFHANIHNALAAVDLWRFMC